MKVTISKILLLICAPLVIMWYTFYNGYPLVTSDTGAYIFAAFDFMILKDRSSFYSIFLAFTGLRMSDITMIRGSLWVPVFFQSSIVAFLLYRLSRHLHYKYPSYVTFIATIIFIAFGTGLSWVASYAMPDVFTGILLLSIILYMFDRETPNNIRIVYLAIIALSILVHNSHFVILSLWAVLMILYSFINNKAKVRSYTIQLLGLTYLCLFSVCTLNFVNGFGFVLSPGAHVFLAGKMAETNVLQTYLQENCNNNDYKLCQYKNDISQNAIEYIWGPSSPFNKIGGWDSSKKEHNKIITEIFKTPRYLGMYAQKAAEHSILQLSNIHISQHEQSFTLGSSPHDRLHEHILAEVPQLLSAKQQKLAINNKRLISSNLLMLIISSIWVIILLIKQPDIKPIVQIYVSILLFILCNAIVTASLANVLNRLQYRVFWVLPATNIIVIINYYTQIWQNRLPTRKSS